MSAPLLRIRGVRLGTRPVRFRIPFHFGAVTIDRAHQAFTFVEVEGPHGPVSGAAADLLAPRWFDKRPGLSPAETVAELAEALVRAAAVARERNEAATVFDHACALWAELAAWAERRGIPRLVAAFATAQLERALADAACRAAGVDAFTALRQGLFGIDRRLVPEHPGVDPAAVLGGVRPRAQIALRHTVGLDDPLTVADLAATARPADGRPVTLEEVIRTHAPRFFKLKLCGDPQRDHARLGAIAALLDPLPVDWRVTLDGNEQYPEPAAVEELLDRIAADPRLRRLHAAVLYLEQPLPRELAVRVPVHDLARRVPLLLDEGDDGPDAFPRAVALGWRGVSVKASKGFFRALANLVRVRVHHRGSGSDGLFLSSEDLTTQAGIALQQDLALALACGCTHSERNGHHFAGGMQGAPAHERRAFLAAHPDLYEAAGEDVVLAIRDGLLRTGSLATAVGLGSAVLPDPDALDPLPAGES